MKSKIAMLVALHAFLATCNVHAGVVGISPSGHGITAAVNQTALTFSTTGSGGGTTITGVGIWTLSGLSGSSTFEVKANGSRVALGSFNYDGSDVGGERLITWSSGYNGILSANTSYEIKIGAQNTFYQIGSNTYTIPTGTTDYWTNPLKGTDTSAAIQLYYQPAAVPEPGTLILTGSALVAGAVGAYLKRRRNKRAQADAHS